MKVLTSTGRFYSVLYQPDADGTYDLVRADLVATLPVPNVQSFVYVKAGSPGFAVDSMLVAEYAGGSIAAYEIDANGNPRPNTRRTFFTGPPFARTEGMMIDPLTNDLLLTTYSSSTSAIYRISGFVVKAGIPISSCQSIAAPGSYYLSQDISHVTGGLCIEIRDTSNVHFTCGGRTMDGHLTVSNTREFSVRDCVLLTNQRVQEQRPAHVAISNSQNGLISHNTLGTSRSLPYYFTLADAQRINIVDNRIYAFVNMENTTSSAVRFNRIESPSTYISGDLVSSNRGVNNVVDANTIDGRLMGHEGGTIGIYLGHETNVIVSGNDLLCTVYCIDLGDVAGGKVNANRAREGLVAFVGHRVTDVTWSRNVAQQDVMVGFAVEDALRNTLLQNSVPAAFSSFRSVMTPAGQNLIKENDFGDRAYSPNGNPDFGPLPVPAGAIIDGGGNKCVSAPGLYPLVCH